MPAVPGEGPGVPLPGRWGPKKRQRHFFRHPEGRPQSSVDGPPGMCGSDGRQREAEEKCHSQLVPGHQMSQPVLLTLTSALAVPLHAVFRAIFIISPVPAPCRMHGPLWGVGGGQLAVGRKCRDELAWGRVEVGACWSLGPGPPLPSHPAPAPALPWREEARTLPMACLTGQPCASGASGPEQTDPEGRAESPRLVWGGSVRRRSSVPGGGGRGRGELEAGGSPSQSSASGSSPPRPGGGSQGPTGNQAGQFNLNAKWQGWSSDLEAFFCFLFEKFALAEMWECTLLGDSPPPRERALCVFWESRCSERHGRRLHCFLPPTPRSRPTRSRPLSGGEH